MFKKEFVKYVGVEHPVAMANGTLALDTALRALGISPGDEVVTSASSFICMHT